jgi:hypothetical protein
LANIKIAPLSIPPIGPALKNTYIHIYIYIYICVCVCVNVIFFVSHMYWDF